MSEEMEPPDIETEYAISAGGVAFRRRNATIEIALIRTSEERKWQLPKGLMDPGETAEETALREVREEAGIVCEILAPIGTIEYSFFANYSGIRKRYQKQVHFFLMRYISGNVLDHDHEVEEVIWIESGRAIEMLEFENEKEVATRALKMIPSYFV